MDLKIIKKKDNPLLSRVEIELEATFFSEVTPKKEAVRKKVSSMEKKDEKLVIVKKIDGDFGAGRADVLVYVYDSEDNLKKIEPKGKKKAESADEKKEEPSEEKKEVPKEEAEKK
ncbi:hypothetical protein KY366_01675 [Candidatus Woesearchaeota archaeon]|nr:hypothetical protein [Candidatus Woesearchaeota archaeon]